MLEEWEAEQYELDALEAEVGYAEDQFAADEFLSWGGGPEPYEPSPYDGTYSEM